MGTDIGDMKGLIIFKILHQDRLPSSHDGEEFHCTIATGQAAPETIEAHLLLRPCLLRTRVLQISENKRIIQDCSRHSIIFHFNLVMKTFSLFKSFEFH